MNDEYTEDEIEEAIKRSIKKTTASTREIAEELGLWHSLVHRRFKELEADGVIQHQAHGHRWIWLGRKHAAK